MALRRMVMHMAALIGLLANGSPGSSAEPNPPDVEAKIVSKLPMIGGSSCRWAAFCPGNPDYVLAESDTKGFILRLASGKVDELPGKGSPVGWVGDSILQTLDAGLTYRLLDSRSLKATTTLKLTGQALPDTTETARQAEFTVRLPADLGRSIPSTIDGGDKSKSNGWIISRSGFTVVKDTKSEQWQVRDRQGKIVFSSQKEIVNFRLSPDEYKLILNCGDQRHIIFNRLTGTTQNLPPADEWRWLPDSSSLLGITGVSAAPEGDIVDTSLQCMLPSEKTPRRVRLPKELRASDLRILDIAGDGTILLEASKAAKRNRSAEAVFALKLTFAQGGPSIPGSKEP